MLVRFVPGGMCAIFRVLLALGLLATPSFAAGSIAGTVGYLGPKVTPAKISATDAMCKVELHEQAVTLAPTGKALANVLVRIVKNAPPSATAPSEPVVINQKDCTYAPRVAGAVRGQKLVLRNADGTMHNVHGLSGLDDKKTLFNVAQPPGAKDVEKDPKRADVVKLTCDIHPWMRAFVVISEHPYFSVSDAQGHFEIKDVPSGSYRVEAWHEKLGSKVAELTVEEGKAADPKLSF